MQSSLALVFDFIKFWFMEAPIGLFYFFISLNKAFLKLFSLRLFIRTYFMPWKNEYRQGLVVFSRAMGIAIKTVSILCTLLLFSVLLTLEICITVFFLIWPFVTVYLLFL